MKVAHLDNVLCGIGLLFIFWYSDVPRKSCKTVKKKPVSSEPGDVIPSKAKLPASKMVFKKRKKIFQKTQNRYNDTTEPYPTCYITS